MAPVFGGPNNPDDGQSQDISSNQKLVQYWHYAKKSIGHQKSRNVGGGGLLKQINPCALYNPFPGFSGISVLPTYPYLEGQGDLVRSSK